VLLYRQSCRGTARRTHHEGMRNSYRILVGKSKGHRPLDSYRRMWEDNIIVVVKDLVCVCGFDSTGLG
jgi:hypothetical protein